MDMDTMSFLSGLAPNLVGFGIAIAVLWRITVSQQAEIERLQELVRNLAERKDRSIDT